jgi:hypothetical protein
MFIGNRTMRDEKRQKGYNKTSLLRRWLKLMKAWFDTNWSQPLRNDIISATRKSMRIENNIHRTLFSEPIHHLLVYKSKTKSNQLSQKVLHHAFRSSTYLIFFTAKFYKVWNPNSFRDLLSPHAICFFTAGCPGLLPLQCYTVWPTKWWKQSIWTCVLVTKAHLGMDVLHGVHRGESMVSTAQVD